MNNETLQNDDTNEAEPDLTELAIKLIQNGKYLEAEQLLEKEIEINYRKGFDEYDGDIVNILPFLTLADMYKEQNDFEKAIPRYFEIINISERLDECWLGSPFINRILNELTNIFNTLIGLKNGIDIFIISLEKSEYPSFYPNNDRVSKLIDWLSDIYINQERSGEGEQLLKVMVNYSKESQNAINCDYSNLSIKLALIYLEQGNLDLSEPLLISTINSQNTESKIISLESLATIYKDQGKLVEAENYFLEALEIRTDDKSVNIFSSDLSECIHHLALFYLDQNKFEKAESYYLKAIEQRNELSDPTDSISLDWMVSLAELYKCNGKIKEPVLLYFDLLKKLKEDFSYYEEYSEFNFFQSSYLINTLNDISSLLPDLCALDDADDVLNDGYALYHDIIQLPPNHPEFIRYIEIKENYFKKKGN